MLKMSNSLQDTYLEELRRDNIQLSLYLINGIKLSGYIASFDQYIIILVDESRNNSQLIYKHAISTIAPARGFKSSSTKAEVQY